MNNYIRYMPTNDTYPFVCVCVPDGKLNNVVGYTRCSAYGANEKDGYIRR